MTVQYAVSGSTAGGERLRYIDALRGLAAMLVLWLHVANGYDTLSPATAARDFWLNDFVSSIDIGRIGVVVFFLISGFVIPFSLHRESGAPALGFAIRRVLRIYPAYWISVPLAALVFFWLPGRPFGWAETLANVALLQELFGLPDAEGVYWTLPVELAFYALTIALLFGRSLFSARRIALLSAALAALHTALMFSVWLDRPVTSVAAAFWPLNLSVMLWGTLYRMNAAGEARDALASALLRALGVFYVLVLPVAVTLATGKHFSYALPYAAAFVVFVAGTRFVRIETALTDWIGRVSYSVYLFHPIVFQSLLLWLERQPLDSPWRTQHLAVYLAVNAALTLAVATLVFHAVERPAIRLGHRLAARIERRGRTSVAAAPIAAPSGAASG